MGAALIPIATFGGAVLAVVCLCYAMWEPFSRRLTLYGVRFKRDLDVGSVPIRPEAFGMTVLALTLMIWAVLLPLTQPSPALGICELLGSALAVLWGCRLFVRFRVNRTIRRFTDQLEGTLRQLSGAVKVGLGLRQALMHVADQSPFPSNRELTRLVGATNLGVSLSDALDELAARIPTEETKMLTRVIRVQTQTGSDLAGIFDSLADTIRDRRRFHRRVSALTAQGRASAWVVGCLPLAIFAFIMVTQPDMRSASVDTGIGRLFLAAGLGLDALAAVVLLSLTRIDA